MNTKAMHKLSYGLFVLTTKFGEKDNGCIINTAQQAASNPTTISICVNKANFTNKLIHKSKKFAISILSENVSFDLIKRFGFQSGENVDKFNGYNNYERLAYGIPYITEATNAYMLINVVDIVDLGSHDMFIGTIEDMEVLSDEPSITYDYYMQNVKPKPQKTVSTSTYRCKICGYEYKGDVLPNDFICPICKHGVIDFEKV